MRNFLVLAMLALPSVVWACPLPGGPPGPCWSERVRGEPPPQGDRSWHLLTQSEGGTVSLLKDMTKRECEFARHRALGLPATEEEVAADRKRFDETMALAQDMCANPKNYEGGGNFIYWITPMCDEKHNAVGYGSSGSSPSHSDIKSAECFR